MFIQERLKKLQQWAKAGVSLTNLPSVENNGSDESELALLQYCYYRLIQHVAGNIIENPNFDVHELVDVLLSSPFGNSVSKEVVVALCGLLMTSDLRPYCKGRLFAPNWTADDVAGTICSLQGGSKDLLKAAKEDSRFYNRDLEERQSFVHLGSFSQCSIEALKAYVYLLVDPRDDKIFYVGKGNGNRVFQHVACALTTPDESDKLEVIRSIMDDGYDVKHYIIRHGLTDEEAFIVESVLIDFLTHKGFKDVAKITNIVAGHHQFDRGIKSVEEIELLYNVDDISEKSLNKYRIIAINVNKTYGKTSAFHPNLYEATRKSWDVSKSKASKADYVLSEYKGIVRAIYRPLQWIEMPSDNPKQKRWAFIGEEITEANNPDIYNLYINKRLPLRKKGAQKPYRYFGY